MNGFPRSCIGRLCEVHTRHDEPVTTSAATPTPAPRAWRGLFKGKIRIIGDIVNVDFTDLWEAAR